MHQVRAVAIAGGPVVPSDRDVLLLFDDDRHRFER
jgi:hypothetical protein